MPQHAGDEPPVACSARGTVMWNPVDRHHREALPELIIGVLEENGRDKGLAEW